MANATIDTPVVPILLVGDADVGKSAFLSYVYRCSLTTYLSS
jgi:DNA replicative helicase MCM subunit Mcm2 (Cdc46/Mcm family)